MLHDAGNNHLPTITNRIGINLNGIGQVFIDQHRMLVRGLHCRFHVCEKACLIVYDLHGTPAQHIRGPDHYRVADAGRHFYRFFDRLVREHIARGLSRNSVVSITIEDAGLSRIALGGLVQRLPSPVPLLATAFLTAFYMGRITFLAFFAKQGAQSHTPTSHESPPVMLIPLVVLATLAVTAGIPGAFFTGNAFAQYLGEHAAAEMNWGLAALAVGAASAGIAYAWFMYQRGSGSPDWYLKDRRIAPILLKQFWIDDAYQRVIVAPSLVIADLLRKADIALVDGIVRGFGALGMALSAFLAVFDRKVVDGGVVDGIGHGVVNSGGQVRRIETGNVQTYLILLVASIIILVVVFAR